MRGGGYQCHSPTPRLLGEGHETMFFKVSWTWFIDEAKFHPDRRDITPLGLYIPPPAPKRPRRSEEFLEIPAPVPPHQNPKGSPGARRCIRRLGKPFRRSASILARGTNTVARALVLREGTRISRRRVARRGGGGVVGEGGGKFAHSLPNAYPRPARARAGSK